MRRHAPTSGFLALLDVIFATVGVFVAIIVIQILTVRPEPRPSEADVYALLLPNRSVHSAVADVSDWRQLGRANETVELAWSAWLDYVDELSILRQGIVKLEIYHDAEAIPNRTRFETLLNDHVATGVGVGRSPPFTVVWRPLTAAEDARARIDELAGNAEL